jgi:hypothetical protein
MVKDKVQLKKLSALMIQFFEKEFEMSEEILFMSGRFIFHNDHYPELQKHPELYDTLLYLKDVKERNYLKDVDDLIKYYDNKQLGIDELFDRFEQAQAEEQLAIRFQNACETHLKIKGIEQVEKNECLYYPISSEAHYLVGYENISYRNSIEEEKSYLARIEGNLLIKQTNVSFISSEKNNQLVSN